jgi:FkbM family methyltransferase
MRISEFLKRIWREVLRIEEEREAFFHGCKKLIQSKHYDRLYRDFKGKGEIVYYSTEDDILYLKTKESIVVSTYHYYDIFLEIFINQVYTLPPQISMNEYVVFDVGMNRGYTSLFFADKKNCKHVYGFELLESTYKTALKNFSLNPKLKPKISAYNYGLWNADSEIEIGLDDCDGHTSIKGVQQGIDKSKFQTALVKKSSTVLKKLFDEIDTELLKVLKIDVEGSEYAIFEDLYKHNLIQEFDVIIGEYHNGLDGLFPYLSEFSCSYKESIQRDAGMMVFINKRNSI